MELKEILSKVDHTLLAVDSTPERIRTLCEEGVRFATASVCIPPCFTAFAKECVQGALPVCTVTGFPNGYMSPKAKELETRCAVEDGADEIDVVINIGMLKCGDTAYVKQELERVRAACEGRILKVIIETCLLTDDEKKTMCGIVTDIGADYIKTSTGFSTAGATVHDVELFSHYVGSSVKIKAAGGIKTLEDACALIEAGASRLGTSRIAALAKAGA